MKVVRKFGPIEYFPLTLSQQDIFYHQAKAPKSPLYNVGGYIRLGKIDTTKLAQAHKRLVCEQEIFGLRVCQMPVGVDNGSTEVNEVGAAAAFSAFEAESAVQYISDERDSHLPLIDLSNKDNSEHAAQLWLKQLFETAIEIDNQPLFRAYLLKLDSEHYYYVGFAHHLAMDGWGFANWAKALSRLYEGLEDEALNGGLWQKIAQKDKDYLNGKKYQSDKTYWQQQEITPTQVLPAYYRSRYQHQAAIPSSREILPIDKAQVTAVTHLAEQLGVSVAQVYLGLVACYFSQSYHQSQLVFGLPAHNRKNHQQKNMLGVFTSISPLKLTLNQQQTFAELVGQLFQQQQKNFRHQRYPIGHIISDIAEHSGEKTESIYDLAFNYLKLDSQLSFDGFAADLVYLSHHHEQTPLSITLWEYGQQRDTQLQLDFNLAYFEQSEVQALKQRLHFVLQQMLDNPHLPIAEYCYLPQQEFDELLALGQGDVVESNHEHNVVTLFADQAKANPDEIAVLAGQQKLTYAQLDLAASQIARQLNEDGLTANQPVGVCMSRRVELIVAIMAVLKAGGAYVPLDPSYPEFRLAHMATDAGLKTILTESALGHLSPLFPDCKVRVLDDVLLQTESQNQIAVADIKQSDLAYVIYTSGSTGKPKGVCCHHGGLLNLLMDFQKRREISTGDQGSLWTSTSFDVSVYEIFSSLCFGATLHLVPEEIRADCDGLFSWLSKNQITSAFLPGFALNPLADWLAQTPNNLHLKRLLVGVEPIFPSTLARIQNGLDDVKIINGYGPSEATICSTLYDVKSVDTQQYHHYVPIGQAVENAQLHILDDEMSLLPKGMVGELYIGGAGVSHGYLNRANLTEDKFVSNPFSDDKDKLYKTGDLVRWLPDGNIAFIGRNDDQVKIRGYRVELEEIETQLAAFAGVTDVLVSIAKTDSGDSQLVAYFTCAPESLLHKTQGLTKLRAHMRKQLPDYMVPTAFAPLTAFPISPNGKIDKGALPTFADCHLFDDFVAAQTTTEKQITNICAQLLRLDGTKVSMSASFFSLGGDSLKVVKFLKALNTQLNCRLGVQDIFNTQTLAELAQKIDSSSHSDQAEVAIKALDKEKRCGAVLSKNQQRLWFIDQFEGGSHQYNMPGGFSVEGAFSAEIAEQALQLIVDRHEILRTVYVKSQDDSQLVNQIIQDDVQFQLPVIDLSHLDEDQQSIEVENLRRSMANVVFDLSSDLMIKAKFVRLGEYSGLMLFNFHHIAFDGWSAGILLNEFSANYTGLSKGQTPKVEPLALQYGDFAIWQQSEQQNNNLEAALGYWQSQLADAPSLHCLTLDKPRPLVKSYHGEQVIAKLEGKVSQSIDTLAQQWGVTPFVLIHSLLAMVLTRHSNENDIVIGTVSANREQPQLQDLIGFFVNTLVLRTNSSGYRHFSEFVDHVNQVNQQAMANQQVPFEMLVDSLDVSRDTAFTPLFQILLTMAVDDVVLPQIPGLETSTLDELKPPAKFDLNLNVTRVNSGYRLQWIYDTALFEHKAIERISGHFCQLAKSVVAMPEAGIGALEMLSHHETQYQLDLMGRTQTSFDKHLKLHRLFESQARKHADKVAVAYQDNKLTYDELNRKANRLARLLCDHGLEAGAMVGICYPRSVDMVVGMMAALKANCAFVPIDLNYPKARIEHMIINSDISHLLIENSQSKGFDSLSSVKTFDLHAENYSHYSDENFAEQVIDNEACLAYVIYTSGSTGMPKGVACYHHSLLNLLADFETRQPVTSQQQCALWTNVSFDVAMYEMFSALCYGATLHVIPDNIRTDNTKLFEFLAEHQINSCYLPGFALNQLNAFIQQNADAIKLSRLLVGVEPIDHQLLFDIQQRIDGLKIINGYGPSETTVCSTLYDVDSPQHNNSAFVPIGTPVANTKLLVLNEHMQLCPLGSVGELYIGGAGLSAGYLNNSAQTQARFVDNPFDLAGEKIYRTGDMVRWDKRGNLHFVGRADFQVKIRGQRIELGEIEQQLNRVAGIDSAIVRVCKNDLGESFLAAHVVGTDVTRMKQEEVRKSLSETLPLHMVPASIMFLSEWPRTANGKIDKKALPQPLLQTKVIEPAETEAEKALCRIWSEVLGLEIDHLGRNSNFFELGGHSLLAVKLLGAVQDELAIELAVKQLFLHPDIAGFAALIDKVKVDAASVGPQPNENALSTSPVVSSAQQRLWFIDQMGEGSAEYNMTMAFAVEGDFDVAVAEQAMKAIIERHQPLRTVYLSQADQSDAVEAKLLPADDFAIAQHELDDQSISKALDAIAAKPFDLAKDLPVRCDFVTTDNGGVLSFCLHHIAADGWSISLMVKEFTTVYQALKSAQPIAMAPLPISYSDYAHWQAEWLKSDSVNSQLSYWTDKLHNLPLVHELSLAQPRSEYKTHQAGTVQFDLPQELTAKMQKLAAERGMTPFMLLHGAFALMVSRHSNNSDIVIGTPVANRNYSQLQGLIGLFVNSLVLRTTTSQPTLNDYLSHVKQVNLDAQANQEVPFEHLVDALQVPRNTRYTPMFQLMISMDVDESPSLVLDDYRLTPMPERNSAVLFDIDLVVKPKGDDIALCWYYDAQLFTQRQINDFNRHLVQLLESFTEFDDKDLPLAELPMLSQQDLDTLVVAPKLSEEMTSKQKLPHQMFEGHVETNPAATAVEMADVAVSYAELNQKANQLARLLIEQGVNAGDYVGVCLPRSIELIESVLAILKVGGVFVPLDPQYPQERLSYMINDTAMKLVLCLQSVSGAIDGSAKAIALDSDDCVEKLTLLERANLAQNHQSCDDLAYVIYTSGSTGRPKGVMVTLGNWLSYHQAAMSLYQTSTTDRIIQFCSISFDVFIEELSLSMLSGATMVIPEDDTVLDADGFWRWINDKAITIATLPTAFWHHLCGQQQLAAISPDIQLRLIATGGESMQAGYLRNWQNWQKDSKQKVKLINMYGPTEATIVVTECDMAQYNIDTGFDNALPVGSSLDNAQLLVLNENQSLVPHGAVGELYIGGGSVALGYLNQPELTEKAFVVHPLTADKSQRWYRTGDLVRYNDKGQLLFLGRIDNQVKLRGYRIELGEIEALIGKHPQVESCLALISEKDSGLAQLVAYVLPEPQFEAVDVADLLNMLKQQLPSHMVPSPIVNISHWPMSPNGKIDRNALPKPQVNLSEEYAAPETETEKQLQQIWIDVLGLEAETLSVTSNFFGLGGHSLLATRLVNRIEQSFALKLPLKSIFTHSTIRQLASLIEQPLQHHSAISKQAGGEAKVLSAQQQRLWLLQNLGNSNSAYNMYQAFELNGELNTPRLQQALDIIVKRHEVLATSYHLQGADIVLALNADAQIPLKTVDLAEQTNTLAQHLIAEQQRVFDLTQAPLMSATVYHLGHNHNVLMICVHHIVADGWSVALFIEELSKTYNGLSANLAPELPKLPIQYSDYSHWQAEQLAQNNADSTYWQAQLAGIPLCHNLPLDKPRPVQQTFNGALYQHKLSNELSQALVDFAKAQDVTLFMLLQSAFAVLLSRYSQSDDIVMGTPVANREQIETENLLGCFVNTLVLRSNIDANSRFVDVLQQNKEMQLEAFAHQSYPFELLVEQMGVERSTAFSPLFQILFVMHNNDDQTLELNGLKVTEKPLKHHMAKFDLSLNVEQPGDQLTLAWEYNVDLFERISIAQLGDSFENLLANLLDKSDLAVELLPLTKGLDKPISQKIADHPLEKGVHRFVEAHAKNTPDAIAIISQDATVSFAELNSKANQMAGYFIEQGINSDSKVAVMLAHQLDTLPCLLALMKIGACYVPLDVNISELRLNQIAQDARINTFIRQDLTAENAKVPGDLIVLQDVDFSPYSQSNQAIEHSGEQLAYILFTSGSTGKPKGVEIHHKSLTNFLLSMAKEPGFTSSDRLLAVTPLTFDISGLELYLPLVAGGTLVLDDSGATQDGKRLNQLMLERDITAMQATPTMWRMLLDSGWQGNPELKLLTGGEAITSELAARLLKVSGEVWNMYGPTETTIWSSCGQLTMPVDGSEVEVHIGQAIDNTELYILDKALNPAGPGVPGQLYIGGEGLAKGYLNRPELTQAQFIDNPFNGGPNGEKRRLYATGDWARVNHNGNIHHLGRLDHQIKLRGFRIEPGEIESALNSHAEVADSLVMVFEKDIRADLVAYYVPTVVGKSIASSELRQSLSRSVPDYMIPAIFMAIDAFGLTASGKKDRKALPEPTISREQLSNEYVAPATELQSFIVGALKRLVQVDKLGIDDNFFDIGATSLDMVKLATELSSHTGREISPVDLFNHANVRQLSAFAAGPEQKITRTDKQTEQLNKAKNRLKNRRKRKA